MRDLECLKEGILFAIEGATEKNLKEKIAPFAPRVMDKEIKQFVLEDIRPRIKAEIASFDDLDLLLAHLEKRQQQYALEFLKLPGMKKIFLPIVQKQLEEKNFDANLVSDIATILVNDLSLEIEHLKKIEDLEGLFDRFKRHALFQGANFFISLRVRENLREMSEEYSSEEIDEIVAEILDIIKREVYEGKGFYGRIDRAFDLQGKESSSQIAAVIFDLKEEASIVATREIVHLNGKEFLKENILNKDELERLKVFSEEKLRHCILDKKREKEALFYKSQDQFIEECLVSMKADVIRFVLGSAVKKELEGPKSFYLYDDDQIHYLVCSLSGICENSMAFNQREYLVRKDLDETIYAYLKEKRPLDFLISELRIKSSSFLMNEIVKGIKSSPLIKNFKGLLPQKFVDVSLKKLENLPYQMERCLKGLPHKVEERKKGRERCLNRDVALLVRHVIGSILESFLETLLPEKKMKEDLFTAFQGPFLQCSKDHLSYDEDHFQEDLFSCLWTAYDSLIRKGPGVWEQYAKEHLDLTMPNSFKETWNRCFLVSKKEFQTLTFFKRTKICLQEDFLPQIFEGQKKKWVNDFAGKEIKDQRAFELMIDYFFESAKMILDKSDRIEWKTLGKDRSPSEKEEVYLDGHFQSFLQGLDKIKSYLFVISQAHRENKVFWKNVKLFLEELHRELAVRPGEKIYFEKLVEFISLHPVLENFFEVVFDAEFQSLSRQSYIGWKDLRETALGKQIYLYFQMAVRDALLGKDVSWKTLLAKVVSDALEGAYSLINRFMPKSPNTSAIKDKTRSEIPVGGP